MLQRKTVIKNFFQKIFLRKLNATLQLYNSKKSQSLLEKRGTPKNKICSKMAKMLPYSKRRIQQLLPDIYKEIKKRKKLTNVNDEIFRHPSIKTSLEVNPPNPEPQLEPQPQQAYNPFSIEDFAKNYVKAKSFPFSPSPS